MPFVQFLKKQLETASDPKAVFERKLAFDEVEILKEMVPGLKQTIQKCEIVEVVVVDDGGKSGKIVGGSEGVQIGEEKKELSPIAENAVPGQPTFFFENV